MLTDWVEEEARRARRNNETFALLNGQRGFDPRDSGKVAAWLRLANGTITGGGYSSVPDLLASNPATQGNSDFYPAAGTSTNGLPTAIFDRTSPTQLAWPIASNNNSTSKFGFACWIKLTSNGAYHCLFNQSSGANKVEIYIDTGRRVRVSKFGIDSSGYNGRDSLTAGNSVPAVGTWFFFRYQFDGSQGTEAGRDKTFIDEVDLSAGTTYSNVGTGGTPVTLRTGSGTCFVGNYQNNSDTTYALDAIVGPNIFILNDSLTVAEGAILRAFEAPT